MLELGIANFMMFFVIIVIGLIFVIAWITKSESRISQAKQDIARLGEEIETYQREKLFLEEKLSTLESAEGSGGDSALQSINPGAPESATREMLRKNEALEKDNKRLKKELGEAKASLEEVYKALSSQG